MRTHLFALFLAATSLYVGAARAGSDQVPPMLVYARGGDLYRTTLDGSETVRLTATRAREEHPAVSPDRLRIAFTRGEDELWLSDAQGATSIAL